MWIARDKNNTLALFTEKPTKDEKGVWRTSEEAAEYFYDDAWLCSFTLLADDAFPDVTFENSPKELTIK